MAQVPPPPPGPGPQAPRNAPQNAPVNGRGAKGVNLNAVNRMADMVEQYKRADPQGESLYDWTGQDVEKRPSFESFFNYVYRDVKKCMCQGIANIFSNGSTTFVDTLSPVYQTAIKSVTAKKRVEKDIKKLLKRSMSHSILRIPDKQIIIDIKSNLLGKCSDVPNVDAGGASFSPPFSLPSSSGSSAGSVGPESLPNSLAEPGSFDASSLPRAAPPGTFPRAPPPPGARIPFNGPPPFRAVGGKKRQTHANRRRHHRKTQRK